MSSSVTMDYHSPLKSLPCLVNTMVSGHSFLIMWIMDFGAFQQQSEEEIKIQINLRISFFF